MRRALLSTGLLLSLPSIALPLAGEHAPVSEPRYLQAVGALEAHAAGNGASSTCTATLVAPGWALTAGHCIQGRTPETFRPLGSTQSYLASDVVVAPGNIDMALVGVPDLVNNTLPITRDCIDQGSTSRIVSVAHDGSGERTETPAQADLDLPGCNTPPPYSARQYAWTQRVSVCGGDSGAPVIVQRPEGQRVIGVVTHRPTTGTPHCGMIGNAPYPVTIIARIRDVDAWIQETTSRTPSRPVVAATLQPDNISDTLALDPRWWGWNHRVTPCAGGKAIPGSLVEQDGSILMSTRLARGCWSIALFHPTIASRPAPATVSSHGPRMVIQTMSRVGTRLIVTSVGQGRLHGTLSARGMRTQRITLRAGVTRLRLSRTIARNRILNLRVADANHITTYQAATRRPYGIGTVTSEAATAPPPLPGISPEPVPLSAPRAPWIARTDLMTSGAH